MNAQAREWLLSFVDFYRTLGFFEEQAHLSHEELADSLEQCLQCWGMDLDRDSARQDYLVIACDDNRVWGTAFDSYDFYECVGAVYGWKLHEDIVKGWAEISSDVFQPQNVRATWINEQEPIVVEFTLSDMPYCIQLEPDLIPGVSFIYELSTLTKLANAINPLIESGRYFAIWDLG